MRNSLLFVHFVNCADLIEFQKVVFTLSTRTNFCAVIKPRKGKEHHAEVIQTNTEYGAIYASTLAVGNRGVSCENEMASDARIGRP